jgi:glycosyltransferase involved in cell wall biosynthesis
LTSPSVGVVIAAWNAERFIEEAIASILGQTRPADTIVVVDDGSTDETADRAGAIDDHVVVIRRPHSGVGLTRNAGIAALSTDLVAFLDADDVWLPHKLEMELAALAADPSLDAVFCLFDEWLDGIAADTPGIRAPRLRQSAPLAGGALLRRAVVDRIGPFRDVPVGDWVQWWARARALQVREHVVPDVLWRRRIHGRNNSLLRSDGGRTFLDIARQHRRDVRAFGGAGEGPR